MAISKKKLLCHLVVIYTLTREISNIFGGSEDFFKDF
jgi:hypothetical protein